MEISRLLPLFCCALQLARAQEVSVRHTPPGMVFISGGEFLMGMKSEAHRMGETPIQPNDAEPVHPVFVDDFWMDATVVTNEQFAEFVEETGYVTVAERKTREHRNQPGEGEAMLVSLIIAQDGPDLPSSNEMAGANWRHPAGPKSDCAGKEKYPVAHVAYEDAEAYARWAGKRLPTEAEFEYAARGGLAGKNYPWGDELRPAGKTMANFREENPASRADENADYALAPVASFPPNAYGLYDVAGNVWQWCSDWYRPDYYAQLGRQKTIAWNPRGPVSSFDPAAPNEKKRVLRGGSFLGQFSYNVGARDKQEVSTGSKDLGFRCVIGAAKTTVGR